MIRVAVLAKARAGHGGTLLYTRSMLQALGRLPSERYAFTVHTQADNHEYDGAGFPVVHLPEPRQIVAGLVLGRKLFADADVVLAPIYSTALLASAAPFAFTLHDLQERHLPENFGLATRLWRHATNRLLTARAGRVVCESNFVRDDIVRFLGAPAEKVAVIPAPPISELRDAVLDDARVEAVRSAHGLPREYLFYPAQFWPHKNHLRLVDAFARIASEFPSVDLVFTGKARDEHARVFDRVRELGLAARVHHLGYVPADDLAALYRGATAAVIPTLFESISIPVYEAFALGTPVCVSNVVALPDQVGDAGLLFDPRSVDDMAATLRRLLAEPELRAELVARGRARMAAVDHASYARRLAGVIDALARPQPAVTDLSRADG
jgi:glycosyltransferase involved in cell wall biosynthesis